VNAMPFVLFHRHFPEVAEKETRVFIVPNGRELPADEYALAEMYCDEHGCDCRRVFFSVVSRKRKDTLAVIAFGWEQRSFYARWLRSAQPDDLDALQGPCLNIASEQSEHAPEILRMVKLVLQDDSFIERLKRHYSMFKRRVDGRQPEMDAHVTGTGRNAPCPCGSGKKYKRCCGR